MADVRNLRRLHRFHHDADGMRQGQCGGGENPGQHDHPDLAFRPRPERDAEFEMERQGQGFHDRGDDGAKPHIDARIREALRAGHGDGGFAGAGQLHSPGDGGAPDDLFLLQQLRGFRGPAGHAGFLHSFHGLS